MKKQNSILKAFICTIILLSLSSFVSAACDNDGQCEFGETKATCPHDCGTANYCGDGSCNNGETCKTCVADCGPCPPQLFCGDGICNNGETCNSCPGDCGVCPPVCTPHAYTACYGSGDNTDRYWYNSCNQQEGLAQDCGDTGYTGNNFCSNNDVYRPYANKGCLNNACYSIPSNVIQQDCGEDSYGNNFCLINDLYRTFTDRGCSAGACFATDSNQLVQDCGDSGYSGNNFCSNNDVYRVYETKGCTNNACFSTPSNVLQQDCGEDSNSSPFCFNNDVFRNSTDRGCSSGICFAVNTTPLVQDCGNSGFINNPFCQSDDLYQVYQNRTCSSGRCNVVNQTILVDDCGEDSYGQLFCSNNDVYQLETERGCMGESCYIENNTNLIQDCGDDSNSSNFCSNDDVFRNSTDRGCNSGTCFAVNTTPLVQDCGNNFTSGPFCSDNDVYRFFEIRGCNVGSCYFINNTNVTQECGNSNYTGNLFCSNDDVYQVFTNRTCNAGNCQEINTTPLIQDCGNSNYTGNPFCSNNDVYRVYTNRTCNAGSCLTVNSTPLIQDCGEDSNSSTFCSDNDVFRNSTDRGCNSGTCFALNSTPLVQDCGESNFSGSTFCSNNDVYQVFTNRTCNSGSCLVVNSTPLIQDCGDDTFSSDSDGGLFYLTFGICSIGNDRGCNTGNCFATPGTGAGSDSCLGNTLTEYQTSGSFSCSNVAKNCNDYDNVSYNLGQNLCNWTDYGCGSGACSPSNQANVDCDNYDILNVDYFVTAQSCTLGCSGSNCCQPQNLNYCGDGTVGGAEQCDDGNLINGDGCSNTCQITYQCNDLVNNDQDGLIDCLDPGCHTDNNANNTASCVPTDNNETDVPTCGNTVVEVGEQCDDGANHNNLDLCADNCRLTFCGDGYRQLPNGVGLGGSLNNGFENCDDGANNNLTNACTNVCTLTFCGDGYIQRPNGLGLNETCDDSNILNGDGCSNLCQITYQCNDGTDNDQDGRIDCLDPGCHTDNNANNTASCVPTDNNETDVPVCGNTVIEVGEQCDDGNLINGDGCSNVCQVTYQCSDSVDNDFDAKIDRLDPGCHTDNNPNNNLTYVPTDNDETDSAVCGNALLEGFEQCDFGVNNGVICNPAYGASCVYCSANCQNQTNIGPYCGDSLLDISHEQCDDGNLYNGDGCSVSCLINYQCNDGTDNDQDGRIDCLDPGCHTDNNANNTASCVPTDNNETDVPVCGNTVIEVGEQCDDGNLINGDGCSNVCQVTYQCSDSVDNDFDAKIDRLDPGCHTDNNPNNNLTYVPTDNNELDSLICGNTIVEVGEQCDDGNLINGDGCSNTCQITYQCNDQTDNDQDGVIDCQDPGCHTDNNANNNLTCIPTDNNETNSQVCGNTILELGEQCDDGNLINGDGCAANCMIEPYNYCLANLDIMYIIDRSSSTAEVYDNATNLTNLEYAKLMSLRLVNLSSSQNPGSGLVSFATTPTVDQPFSFDLSLTSNAISNVFTLLPPPQRTNLGEAIKLAQQQIEENARNSSIKLMVIITDSAPNEYGVPPTSCMTNPTAPNECTDYTLLQANIAKQNGTQIFVLGIRPTQFSQDFLKLIATNASYYYNNPNVLTIDEIYNNSVNQACGCYANNCSPNLYAPQALSFNLLSDTKLVINVNDVDSDGIVDSEDNIIGDYSNINTNLEYLKFVFKTPTGDIMNPNDYDGLVHITIETYGSNKLLEFDYNFTKSTKLYLENITILVNQNLSEGSLIVDGINLQDQGFKKMIYLNNINMNSKICIHDGPVQNIGELSSQCIGANEVIINCPGTNAGYTCELYNNSAVFRINGLSHTAVKQLGAVCGDGFLDTNEECDGSNFGSQTCITKGFNIGTLSCSNECKISTTNCANNPASGGSSSGTSSGSPRSTGTVTNKPVQTNTSTTQKTEVISEDNSIAQETTTGKATETTINSDNNEEKTDLLTGKVVIEDKAKTDILLSAIALALLAVVLIGGYFLFIKEEKR